jgi:hypothetical protein
MSFFYNTFFSSSVDDSGRITDPDTDAVAAEEAEFQLSSNDIVTPSINAMWKLMILLLVALIIPTANATPGIDTCDSALAKSLKQAEEAKEETYISYMERDEYQVKFSHSRRVDH